MSSLARPDVVDVAVVVVVGRPDEDPADQGSTKIVRSAPAGTMQAASLSGNRSSGSVRWVPRLGAILGTSASSLISPGLIRSAQTPVALTTLAASISIVAPVSPQRQTTPAAVPSRSSSDVTSSRFAITAPKRSASPRIVRTRRTSSVWQS